MENYFETRNLKHEGKIKIFLEMQTFSERITYRSTTTKWKAKWVSEKMDNKILKLIMIIEWYDNYIKITIKIFIQHIDNIYCGEYEECVQS